MGNAIKELKQIILHFDPEITDVEVRKKHSITLILNLSNFKC
jgi:hypothetical protein